AGIGISKAVLMEQPAGLVPAACKFISAQIVDLLDESPPMRAQLARFIAHLVVVTRNAGVAVEQLYVGPEVRYRHVHHPPVNVGVAGSHQSQKEYKMKDSAHRGGWQISS